MEFLEKVEQSGKWPQRACTTMFVLIPKNVTSERPIALMTTLIRWWEALRAPEVAKCRRRTLCVNFRVVVRTIGQRDAGAEVLAEQEEWNPFLASSVRCTIF